MILVAAAAIVATRFAGAALLGRAGMPPFVERCLRHTPGTMLVSLIVPDLLSAGPAGYVSAGLTVAIAAITRNMLAAVAGGAVTAVAARHLLAVA